MDVSVACNSIARTVVTSRSGLTSISSPQSSSSSRDLYSGGSLGNLCAVVWEKHGNFLLHAGRCSLLLSFMKPVGTMHFLKQPSVCHRQLNFSSFLPETKRRPVESEAAISVFFVSTDIRIMQFPLSREGCNAAFANVRSKEHMDVDSNFKDDETNIKYDQSDDKNRTGKGGTKGSTQDREDAAIGASLFSDKGLLRRVALEDNADCVIAMLSQNYFDSGRIISGHDCSTLIEAALAVGNLDLAYSVLNAMRGSQIQRSLGRPGEKIDIVKQATWGWPQADVKTYIALVKGLATTLRVSDAISTVNVVKRRGIPAGEEVPFGKVVKCPACKTALAVVQPHQGIQLVPCSKCRYQYELMSGDLVKCESESTSMNISAFEKGLRALKLMKQALPSAVHSFLVRSPDGIARTYRFATASADVPAQEGERVTVAAAAPMNSFRGIGPFKLSARSPGWRPSEPMCITNHATGCVYHLLRAPPKSGSGAALDTSFIIPAALLLASSDAATALIDPTLPRTIAIGAAVATVLGTVANTWLLPQFNQLPQRTADAIAVRQELLSQYEVLQARLQELTQGAAEEVRMLARMSQLYNKMEALQETAYSARMERVRRARDGLDQRLASRLELMDNYAKVSSMIEIEVEMDLDVLAAEAGSTVASITTQIERLEEVERLQKQWKIQAEANDELERLLQSSPVLPDVA